MTIPYNRGTGTVNFIKPVSLNQADIPMGKLRAFELAPEYLLFR